MVGYYIAQFPARGTTNERIPDRPGTLRRADDRAVASRVDGGKKKINHLIVVVWGDTVPVESTGNTVPTSLRLTDGVQLPPRDQQNQRGEAIAAFSRWRSLVDVFLLHYGIGCSAVDGCIPWALR